MKVDVQNMIELLERDYPIIAISPIWRDIRLVLKADETESKPGGGGLQSLLDKYDDHENASGNEDTDNEYAAHKRGIRGLKAFLLTESPSPHSKEAEVELTIWCKARALVSAEDLKQYYPTLCMCCGYKGSSEEWDCHAIADTGDYSEPTCPKCGNPGMEDAENIQPVQDDSPFDHILYLRGEIERLENKYYEKRSAEANKLVAVIEDCHESLVHYREMKEKNASKNVMANVNLILMNSENKAKEALKPYVK